MSESLSAAAAALGMPEALVQRSAEARASATGSTVEEILAAWAGGAPAPAVQAPAPSTPTPGPADEMPPEPQGESQPAAQPGTAVVPPPAPPPSVPSGPYKPPVLVGASDNPLNVLVAVIGLFMLVLLVGLVGPSIPVANAGARTSAIDFGATGEDGRVIYSNLGCAACHTQMVRPVIGDVGLGAVTLNDTNQVIGARRFGPDLSNIGARMSPSQIEAVVGGLDGHPPQSLSTDDMKALVTYLSLSFTAEEDGT